MDDVAATTERNLGGRRPAVGSFLSIDADVHGRIVERLGNLQIAQTRNRSQLPLDFEHVLPAVIQAGAAGGDLDRRGRAEAHHLADDVGRFEREPQFGEFAGEQAAQFILGPLRIDPAAMPECDAQNPLFRAPRPLKHPVHRKAGGNGPHITQRQRDVLRSDVLADRVENSQRILLGRVKMRPVGGPKPQPELVDAGTRKNLQPQLPANTDDHQQTDRGVDRNDDPGAAPPDDGRTPRTDR